MESTVSVSWNRPVCCFHIETFKMKTGMSGNKYLHELNRLCMEVGQSQTWGQLLSNVIDYITITLQFSR